MNTVTRRIWGFFFRLIRTCGCTGLTGVSCSKANSQSSHLYANASCKSVLRVFTADMGASQQVSRVRRAIWRSSLKWGTLASHPILGIPPQQGAIRILMHLWLRISAIGDGEDHGWNELTVAYHLTYGLHHSVKHGCGRRAFYANTKTR